MWSSGSSTGLRLEPVAALDAPLQLADPHRHARQLGGVLVELDAEHVVRAGHVVLALQAQRLGLQVDLVLDVLQALQRQVEEVAAAAGRVEHAVGLQPLQEADERGLRVALGLVAVASCSWPAPSRSPALRGCHSASSGRCTTGSTSRRMVAGSV